MASTEEGSIMTTKGVSDGTCEKSEDDRTGERGRSRTAQAILCSRKALPLIDCGPELCVLPINIVTQTTFFAHQKILLAARPGRSPKPSQYSRGLGTVHGFKCLLVYETPRKGALVRMLLNEAEINTFSYSVNLQPCVGSEKGNSDGRGRLNYQVEWHSRACLNEAMHVGGGSGS